METRAGTGTVTRLVAKTILDQDKDDSVGHGSRITSKAKGLEFGIAKNVDIVMVRISLATNEIWPSTINALEMVAEDIWEKGLAGKAFVNLSWHLPIGQSNAALAKFKEALRGVIAADGIVVTSAGNTGTVIHRLPVY